MLNNSLFICYSTTNYSKLTIIFLESLNNLEKNIIKEDKDILYFMPVMI